MRTALFVIVVLLLLGGIYAWVGYRLLGSWQLGRPARAVAWTLLFAHMALLPATFAAGRLLEGSPLAVGLAWATWTTTGFFWLLLALLALRDMGWLALAALRWVGPDSLDDLRLLKLPWAPWTAGVSLALSLALTAVAMVGALGQPALKRVELRSPHLPAALDGYTIAHLTDIHLGPTIGAGFLSRVVADVNEVRPDLVAITGDLVDGTVAVIGPEAAPLQDLQSRDGAFFVTGNHEYYWDAEGWIRHLGGLGVSTLVNEHVVVERAGALLTVAGVTDAHAASHMPHHASDPAAALEGAPRDSFKLLLAHQPVSVMKARGLGAHVALAGHTHGGQFWPWTWLVGLAQPVLAGVEQVGEMLLYTSRGTGYWGPPLRLGAPAEITIIELRRGS